METLQKGGVHHIGGCSVGADDFYKKAHLQRALCAHFELLAVAADLADGGGTGAKHRFDGAVQALLITARQQLFAIFDDTIEPWDEIAVAKRRSICAKLQMHMGICEGGQHCSLKLLDARLRVAFFECIEIVDGDDFRIESDRLVGIYRVR